MTTKFSAVEPLQIPAANFTGDPLQVTQAFSGLIGRLSAWSQKVAALLNRLSPGGGAVPVSQGGTGDTTLTAHAILVGEGTAAIATVGPGASGIPLIGQGAADPVFGTAVIAGGGTGAVSFTPADALMLAGTTSTGALQASQNWSQSTSVTGQFLGNFNTASIPSTITGLTGADFILQSADASPCIITQIAYAGASQNQCYRAEGTGTSPLATGAGQTITSMQARGYDGTNWLTSNMAIWRLMTQNQTSSTDHSSQAQLILTPKGSTAFGTVAVYQAAADGGHQLAGNTSGVTVPSGNIGEYLSTVTPIGSEVSINSANNVATLNIPAGDWDVWGELWVDLATGTATPSAAPNAALTTSSATLPTVPADNTARSKPGVTPTATGTTAVILPVGPMRVLQSITNNFFLVGQQIVSGGTANGYGKICARRRQ